LEGLSIHGANLTKLLLGLGRIFGVMAAKPEGHSPEVNQFYLNNGTDIEKEDEAEELLRSAVMHLALVRWPGNKLADDADTKEYDYMVHPIFTPFFVFSYRRKRKMRLSAGDLVGLVEEHRNKIREILGRTERSDEEPLPEQLEFFGNYYRGGSSINS
jgi:hypothetical protein